MANWCANQIQFTGSKENENKVAELFMELLKKEKIEQCGQKPEFSKLDDYFFNISVDDGIINFETKWTPKIAMCVEIAKYFSLNFEYTYDECGNQIFGKAIYTEGNEEAEELDLCDNDYNLFSYDEETALYSYNGENYESDFEILENIWNEKFNSSY